MLNLCFLVMLGLIVALLGLPSLSNALLNTGKAPTVSYLAVPRGGREKASWPSSRLSSASNEYTTTEVPDPLIAEFLDIFTSSVKRETFIKLHLSQRRVFPEEVENIISSMKGALLKPSQESVPAKKTKKSSPYVLLNDELISLQGRRVLMKSGDKLQLHMKYKFNDQVKNFDFGTPAVRELEHLLIEGGFKKAQLVTKSQNVDLRLTIKKGKRAKGSKLDLIEADNKLPSMSYLKHDRTKKVIIETGVRDSDSQRYLHGLDVVNADGVPYAGMGDKLRQIQKFVEIVGNVYNDAEENKDKQQDELVIADMGCGLGYLTFALHDHLRQKLATTGVTVKTIGVEARPKLVERTNQLARSLGLNFTHLAFVHSTIQEFFHQRKKEDKIDLLVALHACDTATDDAIFHGITDGSEVIVTAPCCHKELRKQIDSTFLVSNATGVYEMLRHGIYRERQNEMVTDSLRTLVLERFGYRVTVLEFVGGEHTAKNVMLLANKRGKGSGSSAGMYREAIDERIKALTLAYGLKQQTLLRKLELDHLLLKE